VYLSAVGINVFDDTLFLRVFRVFRVFRVSRAWRSDASDPEHGQDSLARVVGELIIVVFVMIFVSASVIQIVEYTGGHDLSFHDCVYFVVISTTTVGYGDIAPQTVLGKMYVSVCILFAISLIPVHTAKIVEILTIRNKYQTPFVVPPKSSAVLLVGDISLRRLRALIAELFHPCHGKRKLHVVILSPKAPDNDMELFLRNRMFTERLHYIQGSSAVDADLRRTDIDNLAACILFTNIRENPKSEDEKTLLRALAVRNVSASIPLMAELATSDSKEHAFSAGVQYVICREDFRRGLLSRNTIAQGTSTLLANLLRHVPALGKPTVEGMAGTWLAEYQSGQHYSIFSLVWPNVPVELDYLEVVMYLFENHRLIAIGLIRDTQDSADSEKEENATAALFPCDDHNPIRAHDVLLVLAVDARTVSDVINRIRGNFKPGHSVTSVAPSRIGSPRIIIPTEEVVLPSTPDAGSSAVPPRAGTFYESRTPNMSATLLKSISTAVRKFRSSTVKKLLHTCPPRSLVEATINEVSQDMSNHIIVGGDMGTVEDFISPLRRVNLGPAIPIVILSPDMTKDKWMRIDMYTDVYVVHGECQRVSNLIKCGVSRAMHVVYLAADRRTQDREPQFVDFPSIMMHHTLLKNFPSTLTTIEHVYGSNIAFLEPKLDSTHHSLSSSVHYSLYAPLYAAGMVFADTFIDQYAASAYFNPFVIELISELIGTAPPHNSHDYTGQRQLFRVPLPEACINKQWRFVFEHFISNYRCLPIAAYRAPATLGSLLPYVYTSPELDCILGSEDDVFVIADKYPQVATVARCASDTSFVTPKNVETDHQLSSD
jgi:hypothetical protein